MLVFTVHEPPAPAADRLDRAEQIIFVRDSFSLYATLLGTLWLLINGLWLAAAIAIGLLALVVTVLWLAGAATAWLVAAIVVVHLIIGFEGRNIERWTLGRRGWTMVGSVSGRDVEECERRFFEAWLPKQPFVAQESLSAPGATLRGVAGAERPRRSLLGRLMGRA